MPFPSVLMSRHCLAVLAACLAVAGMSACATQASSPADTAVACQDLTPDRGALSHHLRADRRLMGTSFQIRAVTAHLESGCRAINAAFDEVARQEALFSEYQAASDISAINRGAGGDPIEVDAEVFTLLQRSLWASRVTSGAFDITFAGCGTLWSIREQRIPDDASLAACLDDVDFRRIRLDPWRSRVQLPRSGMRIGLGGIAKGYGVDAAADVLRAHDLTRFVVDGGGDLFVEGTDIDGAWAVQIAHPRNPQQVFSTLRLDRGAIVTSGDYLRYFERDGIRYHHILDPATGQPARRSISVTVIAPSATDADALATGLFVLGPDRGLAVVAGLPGVEALFFDPDLRVRTSRGFPRGLAPASSARVIPNP